MDLQVVYRDRRQSGHESLPARSTVSGHVRANITPEKKKIAIRGIFANDVHEVRAAGREMVRPALPVHHLLADDLPRGAEGVFRLNLHPIHDHGEFGFHADRRELDPLLRGCLVLRSFLLLFRHALLLPKVLQLH